MTPARTENMAKFACAYGGLAWGLFWMPLRGLDAAGITGAWATVMFYVLPFVIVVPVFIWRWRSFFGRGWHVHLVGMVAGLSLVLYSDAFLYTEVIRAMLLYYLTPVWSTLLARVWLGEPITPIRVVSIVLGLFGMLVIFGIDVGIPLPRNAGDWMGLASGMIWAVAAVLMRDARGNGNEAADYTVSYFLWGSVAAVAIAVVPFAGINPAPAPATVAATLPWFLPVLLVLVVPAVFAVMWGTPHLNPGMVALLFMTEISVGTVTAAIWAGEPFGLREMSGIVLITLAGLAEVVVIPLSRVRFRRT